MGTKPRSKGTGTAEGDDTKPTKTKKSWLMRMIRKRKYKSLHEENINDNAKDSEREPNRMTIMENDSAYLRQEGMDGDDIETMSQLDGEDHRGNDVEQKDRRKKSSDGGKNKFGSALKFFKQPFKRKKRKKQQKDYDQFCDSLNDLYRADVNGHAKEDEQGRVEFADDEEVEEELGKNKYVRFEPVVDEHNENVEATIDAETTAAPKKKKKKSAKKRVAKAGRETGRVFSVGMLQIGKNLQYLTPMPSAHVFAEAKSSGHSSTSYPSKPKNQNYKYSASAPSRSSNAYAFI